MSGTRRSPVPAAANPAEAARGFARALLGSDAASAASYFATGAQLVTPDGTELGSRKAIAELLGQLTDSEDLLEIRTGRTLRAGPVALCTQYWKRSSTTTQAESFQLETTASLVLAQQGERWEILIATPWS